MTRNEELQEKLSRTSWDLVIFDEAHKLAAHFYGSKLEKTGRFILAEKLGAHTRHLLLMTATPHSGKEEDFQLFLSLLDSDRFYGKFRDGVHKVDSSDLMRRMVKEELLKFDGTPLFPERRAYTVNYKLSGIEAALYEAVTSYVQEEMGKADAAQRSAERFGRFRSYRTPAPPRLQSRGHFPIPQAPPRTSGTPPARGKARRRGQQILAETLGNAAGRRRRPQRRRAGGTGGKTHRSRPPPLRRIAELEAEILILARLVEQARGVVDSDMIASGTSSRKFSRTIPTCAMQAVASAS